MKKEEIKLENGKYTFYIDADHYLNCLSHFSVNKYNDIEFRDLFNINALIKKASTLSISALSHIDEAILALFREALENREKIDKIIKLINMNDFFESINITSDIQKIIEGKM